MSLGPTLVVITWHGLIRVAGSLSNFTTRSTTPSRLCGPPLPFSRHNFGLAFSGPLLGENKHDSYLLEQIKHLALLVFGKPSLVSAADSRHRPYEPAQSGLFSLTWHLPYCCAEPDRYAEVFDVSKSWSAGKTDVETETPSNRLDKGANRVYTMLLGHTGAVADTTAFVTAMLDG
jgi:hypothetical protein